MAITAALVKELRERTGAGMMECKKALQETDGNIDAAVDHMRKTGLAKADKKAGRTAAEGAVIIATGTDGTTVAMVEVNSETDFVGKGDDFRGYTGKVADLVLSGNPADLDALAAMEMEAGKSVDEVRREMVARLGEKIDLRRFICQTSASGKFSSYSHDGRIGVVVEVEGGDEELGKDLAMHIAASKPVCVDKDQVDPELISKERDIFVAQAAESGKPADIIEKMVEGRIRKYLAEITLVGQPFVKDPDQTVEKLLASKGAKVLGFTRFELGEGIEKKVENFADEVMAQVRSS